MRSNTIINYVFCSEKAYENVIEFNVCDRVDSDQRPILIILKDKKEKEEGEKKRKGKTRRKKRTGRSIIWEADKQDTIEAKWDKLKHIVHEAMIKKKILMKRKELGLKDWDKQFSRKKKRVQKSYKRWKMSKIRKKKYLQGAERFCKKETTRKKGKREK
ncbi:hypothetical protein ACFW04_013743 [Cataglyphis niger]